MDNCIYVKKFENGIFYIGVTNNFRKRMNQHNYMAFTVKKKLFLYNLMRKYKHTTCKLAEGIKDRELLLELEKETIKFLKNNGYKLCNTTEGGEGKTGFKMKPETLKKMSEKSKGIKKPRTSECNIRFKNVKKTDEHKKKISDSMKNSEKAKLQRDKLNKEKMKSLDYYAEVKTTKSNFKKFCKNRNLSIFEFDEIWTGERYKSHKLYFFKPKTKTTI